jgi:hypothetical protein
MKFPPLSTSTIEEKKGKISKLVTLKGKGLQKYKKEHKGRKYMHVSISTKKNLH